jgi:predicted DNA-binding transcriptional regulator YafY
MLAAMRASRLVQLLLLLQARGRLTAAALAAELEVSERTIHRDVEALSAAGVPIYAERGPHGGIQLVDGYRTRLTGLTGDEAEALFLSGIPGPAAELGLGTVVAAARLKVLAALPGELRARASRLVERFHLDAAGWFHATESVPHLGILANAVWEAQRVTVGYRRAGGEVGRVLEPLGLVLKAGIWYVVALASGEPRTYRVSRFSRVTPSGTVFMRPPGFDLAAYWSESITAYERDAPRVEVLVRIDPHHYGSLADLVGERAVRAADRVPDDRADGWHRLRLSVDWPAEVPARLAALGDVAEVLEPAEIRDRVIDTAERVLARYRSLS